MILITGATGMLGSHLAYHLLKTKKKIRAIKRNSSNLENVRKTFAFYSDNSEDIFNQIEWLNADLLDYDSLLVAMENVTEIYHCAAIVSFNSDRKDEIIENNVQGTANIVNAALKQNIQKFCHVSSIAALGEEAKGLINEKSQRNPTKKYSAYSESKFLSELEVWRAAEEGLNVVIINPSIILGAFPDWTQGSASLFFNVSKGLKFYTKGKTGYIDVNDVVEIMLELMNKNIFKERFILSAENLSYQEIFNLIAKSLNVAEPNHYANNFVLNIASRLDKIRSFFTRKEPTITRAIVKSANKIEEYSNSKIKELLNYNFTKIEISVKKIAKKFCPMPIQLGEKHLTGV